MFCISLLTTLALNLQGQTIISGRVTNEAGEAIPGANVSLRDTYDGTTTDATGEFEFSTSEDGEAVLSVSFVGYREFSKPVLLEKRRIRINASLKEEINELQAVIITAGSFTASDESRRTVFRPVDIATTAGATADIAAALNTLPGTQKVGESGRLFVRGGDGEETRTFIDGMQVQQSYQPSAPNAPSRGRFLPFMFKGTSFSTGGYSSEYGQALSSALVLDSKDRAESTRTDIGLLSVGGDISHTHAWEKASLAGKIQYTNIRPYFNLINQEIDWIKAPASIQGTAAFRQETGKGGIIKAFGNFNRANFSLLNHGIDDYKRSEPYELTNDYQYINLGYKGPLSENWSLRSGFSYTSNIDEQTAGEVRNDGRETGLHAKTVVEGSLSEHLELKTGGEVVERDYDLTAASGDATPTQAGFTEVIAAGFAESNVYVSNNFVLRLGVRGEYINRLDKASVDPRVSLAYRIGHDGSFSLAYGKFRQSPKNEWLRIDNRLEEEKADHYIASYQHVDNNRTFRAELYYKRYYDLIKYTADPGTSIGNDGTGYARGLEFFWRDNESFQNTDYWISYSYLDTKRDYLNFPGLAPPSFASAHNVSLVYKYFIAKIKTQVGATYSFASGRPYDDPNTYGFNSSRTPNYQDLSLNIAWLPRPQIVLYASVTNLLGRDNIFGYEFSDVRNDDGIYNGRALRQAARRFVFVGVFITFSKNKTVNQLPSL